MDQRTRTLVEQEIKAYPAYVAKLNEVVREHAEHVPIQYLDDMPRTAGKVISDPTWRAIERIHRDPEYKRCVRVVRGLRTALAKMDAQCHRIVELWYWRGLDMRYAMSAVGIRDQRTMEARRREIASIAIRELARAGVPTFVKGQGRETAS